MRFDLLIIGLWAAWILSWIAAAAWANKTEKRIGLKETLRYRALMMLGFVLLAIPAHRYRGVWRLWQINFYEAWLCVILEAAGFAFCWWARLHLGKLWSGAITRKADHHLVDSGPYAIVRHPIYTGLILALLATMIAKGTVAGVAGTIVAVLGMYVKASYEENWLRGELGAEIYDGYRKRVPMLLPFGPKSS